MWRRDPWDDARQADRRGGWGRASGQLWDGGNSTRVSVERDRENTGQSKIFLISISRRRRLGLWPAAGAVAGREGRGALNEQLALFPLSPPRPAPLGGLGAAAASGAKQRKRGRQAQAEAEAAANKQARRVQFLVTIHTARAVFFWRAPPFSYDLFLLFVEISTAAGTTRRQARTRARGVARRVCYSFGTNREAAAARRRSGGRKGKISKRAKAIRSTLRASLAFSFVSFRFVSCFLWLSPLSSPSCLASSVSSPTLCLTPPTGPAS